MIFYDYTTPKMIVAEKSKHIRSINDTYIPEHYDEEGNLIEEHVPHYSTTIFVPNAFTESDMYQLYIEENI